MFRADGFGSERKSCGGTIYIVALGFNPMDDQIGIMYFKVLKID
ncbi:hypothetical protein ACHRV6_08450 [Flavobacterium sp. FlaQc-51]